MNVAGPAVSVVVPCFNYERYVGACVRSALEQRVPPLEVIVVNDGSTDRSAAVLAAFGDRIRLVEQENAGHVAALNRGFAASRGGVVMFLDADDVLHPDAVGEVVRAWTPACAKVQFELELIDARGAAMGRRFCNYVRPYDAPQVREEFRAFGTYVWPVSSGNAYSRWFLERLLPLSVDSGPDGVLNTLAPLYGEVRVVPRTLAYYRMHEANQSGVGKAEARDFVRIIQLRAREFSLLAQHAERLGQALPCGNLMDHELRGVSYRLMLNRLGEEYEGASGDTPAALWRAGLRVLRMRPLPAKLKLMHGAWLTVLLCSPWPICRRLILLHLRRAALVQPMRRAMTWLTRRPAVR